MDERRDRTLHGRETDVWFHCFRRRRRYILGQPLTVSVSHGEQLCQSQHQQRMVLVVAIAAFCLNLFSLEAIRGATAFPPADRDARALFAVVLAKEKPPVRCQYDIVWARGELPDYVAKAVFHLTIGAGLVPPSVTVTGDPQGILDPNDRFRAALCSNSELKSYTAQRVEEFERGTESFMQIARTTFDYPLFDRSRKNAVVIITRLALDGRSRWNGKIGRHPTGFHA